jgi:O-antigen/teichoic acid export membrane protein
MNSAIQTVSPTTAVSRPRLVVQASPANSIFWLVMERALKAVGGMAVAVVIARHLGPENFGRYGAAIGLATLAKELVMLGIDRLIRRDLARNPEKAGSLVGTSVALASGAAFLVAAGLSAAALWTIEDPLTRRMTLIVVWMALPQAFFSAELWFESTCDTRPMVWGRNLVWFTSVAARLIMAWRGSTALGFATFALVEWAATYGVVWFLFRQRSGRIPLSFSRERLGDWAREGWPAFVMVLVGATANRIMVVVVQHLATNEAAGYLSAALRVTEVWWSFSAIFASILLPRLVTIRRHNLARFQTASQTYADLSFLVGLVAALGITLLAPLLVPLLFGSAYVPTTPVLVILFWSGPAIYPGVARTQLFVLRGRLRYDLIVVSAIALTSVCLVLFLVPHWGAIGAAIAMCASQWIGIYLVPLLLPQLRRTSLPQWKAFSAPFRVRRVIAEIPALIQADPTPPAGMAAVHKDA